MGVVHDVDVVAERSPQRVVLLVDLAQLAAADAGPGGDPRGHVRLDAVEALRDAALGVLDPRLHGVAVEVRVDRDPRLARPAQEGADGNAEQLALEVPERLVDAADGAREHDAARAIAGPAVRIEVEIDLLDLERVASDDAILQCPDHLGDDELLVAVRRLADAPHALVREHADVRPLAPVVGLHELHGDVGDLHRALLLRCRGGAGTRRPIVG